MPFPGPVDDVTVKLYKLKDITQVTSRTPTCVSST